jgi:hypothetical protein
MQMTKATRKKVKLKMSISSPTGFGKTTSALLIAYGLTGDWNKICVIDTENDSAALYANHKLKNGFVIGEFQTIAMRPPYSVKSMCEAADIALNAGIEVVILDSIYHYWHGKGGVLDFVGNLGGRFQDWAKGSPMWQQLLDKILQSPAHFISTIRKKQAYEIVQGSNGKKEVEKKGMEDQVRDGFDYEMTVAFELVSDRNMAKAAKDRTGLFAGEPEFVISVETGKRIKEWCESGAEPLPQDPPQLPLLGDNPFIQAQNRIQNGDSEVYAKLKAAYTLTPGQTEVLDALQKELLEKAAASVTTS